MATGAGDSKPGGGRRHHVIVGAGPAGMAAVEAIREVEGAAPEITVVSAEPAYSRMALPYWISGRIGEEQLALADAATLKQLDVRLVTGSRAAALDAAAGQLTLDDGTRLDYHRLLVATGARPTRLVVPGADRPGVTCLWTRDDAARLIDRLDSVSRVALVGAGFIGMIVANALLKRGCSLAVIEREPQLLPRMLEPQAAGLVEQWLRDRGVAVSTAVTLEAIDQAGDGGHAHRLRLAGGESVDADVVVLATGITPNVEWLEGSGVALAPDGGILVDDRLQTAVAGVFAAGDCASGPDLLAGGAAIHAIQPTAVDHGRVAGANMAGRDTPYAGSLLVNVLDVAGLMCVALGAWRESDPNVCAQVVDASRFVWRKLVFDSETLVGASLVGPAKETTLINDVGMLKGCIQSRAPLGRWRDHLRSQPHDVRRVYLASGVGARLLAQTSLGVAARPRVHRWAGLMPAPATAKSRGTAHGQLVGTRPADFDSLGHTPTVGLTKPPAEPPEPADASGTQG